ncbi:MAG: hypothetical protein EPN84_03740 [Legionella sp.]|nr:MAG: hypothetical protein EPN84_03740 [Legionella sp.]
MDDAAALLALNKNLRHLDVSNWRNVTDAGIRSIGEIGNLTSLTMIGMVRSCSKAVELNKNITHLDLSFNSTLGHAGFAAFATPDRLAKFQSLTLFSCGLTDASVDLMLQMPNLTFAQVEENPISFAKKQQLEAHIQANISRIFGTSVSNVANKTTYAGKRYADPLSKVEVAEPRHVTFGHTNVTNDLHKRIIHSNGHPGFWNDLNRGLAGAASKFDVDNDTLNDHNKLTATA